jgi:prophage tail gpP-like protein
VSGSQAVLEGCTQKQYTWISRKRNKVVYANDTSERAIQRERERERERERTHAIFAVATVRIPISLVHDTRLRD